MLEFLKRIKTYLEVSHVAPISRRYFIMNGFDGTMIILGIVIGAHVSGVSSTAWIVTTGLGASLAMGVSGFFSAYVTERAERVKIMNDLERSMLKKLDKTVIGRASRFASFWTALVNGFSPFILAIIALIPFFLTIPGIMPVDYAIQSSMGIALFILFMLGVFLGRVSKENILVSGLKMLLAGLFLTLISFAFKLIS
jgi:predicted membrane protein (TIGR00267 family)